MENELAETVGTGIHAKRNKRRKELAKQKKIEAQANAGDITELVDKLSATNLEAAHKPNNVSINSKKTTVIAESLESNGNKYEVQSPGQSSNEVLNNIPTPDGALYEIKPTLGKGLGMFAIDKIKKGTEILREESIFKGSNSWFSKHAMFTLLSEEVQSQYMALHSQCNCGKTNCEETDFMKIWDVNSFEVTVHPALPLPNGYAGPFLYLVASRINHDCAPNTQRGFTDKCQIVFQANRDIQAGEEITTNYMGLSSVSAAIRRQNLFKKYQFTCTCQACARNLRLLPQNCAKSFCVDVITRPGLPVLGAYTAMQEEAFAEADTWHLQLKSGMALVLGSLSTIALAQKMMADGDNSDMTFERIYKEKMQRVYEFVLQNDKYHLGGKIFCFLVTRLKSDVVRQVQEEFEMYRSIKKA